MKHVWKLLTLLVALLIFFSSSIEGELSGNASLAIAARLREIFPLAYDTLNFIVRKIAHFMVFFLLAFCAVNALKHHTQKAPLMGWGFATVYAIFDEIHQYFVPGRVFAVTDILIDSAGALAGAFTAYMLIKKNILSPSKIA